MRSERDRSIRPEICALRSLILGQLSALRVISSRGSTHFGDSRMTRVPEQTLNAGLTAGAPAWDAAAVWVYISRCTASASGLPLA